MMNNYNIGMGFETKEIKRGDIPNNVYQQIRKSSAERSMNPFLFAFKRLFNFIFETLAYNCPINSMRVQLHRWRGVHIAKHVHIGRRCTLDHAYPEYIFIKEKSALTGDVYILAHTTQLEKFKNSLNSQVSPVVIEEEVLVGIRVTILPGVTIGRGSIISAGTIINKDVPANTIVAAAQNRTVPLVVTE